MLGHANVLPCSSGLVWNESRLSCVYKFQGTGGPGSGVGGGVISPGGTSGSGKFRNRKYDAIYKYSCI